MEESWVNKSGSKEESYKSQVLKRGDSYKLYGLSQEIESASNTSLKSLIVN